MLKCLVCEKYTMKWEENIGTCTNCDDTLHREEYLFKQARDNKIFQTFTKTLKEEAEIYSLSEKIERLKKEYKDELKNFDDITEKIEKGNYEQGKIIDLSSSGIEIVDDLLNNYNPPEIYSAAYKVRSTMENWLKYERQFDLNSDFYPRSWRYRKDILFKEDSKEFANDFVMIYQLMNIFIHRNTEDLFHEKIITLDDKINEIKIGVEFINENKLIVKDEIDGMIKLFIKHDSIIYDIALKFFKDYPTIIFSDKSKITEFNKARRELSYKLVNQDKIINYLISKNVELPVIRSTSKYFDNMWFKKYNTNSKAARYRKVEGKT